MLNILLWLSVSSLAVGGLWLLLRPYPRNPLRGWILAAQILIAAAIPMILLAVFQYKPENLAFIGLTTGVMLAAFIILLFGHGQGQAYEQEIGELEAGHMLARWECTVAEYRAFLKSELARLSSEVKLFIGFSFGLAGAGAVLFAFFSLILAWAMGGILLGAGLVVSLISYLEFLNVRARYAAADLEAGEILFGPNGVLMFGRFIPLRGFNLWLEKVTYIAPSPSRLHFVSAYRRRNGRGTKEVYIPVPAKHRPEAKTLVAKYQGSVQK
ncbi:MAG: hypothetical protein L6R45_02685 [Anaerolineae bacterium]|nr:hypothetical protein [Anaerolineae bacterium]